jgi:hypothetical protein
MKKIKVALHDNEWSVTIRALNDLRTSLINEGRYTDIVDEILLKIICATKKIVS